MSDSKFIIADNPHKTFSDEDIVLTYVKNRNSRVIVLSFQDLVDLQTTITTYFAGERLP